VVRPSASGGNCVASGTFDACELLRERGLRAASASQARADDQGQVNVRLLIFRKMLARGVQIVPNKRECAFVPRAFGKETPERREDFSSIARNGGVCFGGKEDHWTKAVHNSFDGC
jgi:hypothetical protein